MKTNDGLNHGKFAESPEIVQLIGQRLMTGQPLTDLNVSLGEGVAAVVGGAVKTVGTVAETAASAPITMLQKPTVRETQNTKAQDIGESLQVDKQSEPLTQ